MSFKYRYGDHLAVGFGKCKLLGGTLFSVATAQCQDPGWVGATGPMIRMGERDMGTYKEEVAKLKRDLLEIGVRISGDASRLKSNWHYSCTASVGSV